MKIRLPSLLLVTAVYMAVGFLRPDAVAGQCYQPCPTFVRGDANHDGWVDMSDAIWIFAWLNYGGPPPWNMDAADANDDGWTNMSDGMYILYGYPIPAPYPGAGLDTTPDDLEWACDVTPTTVAECPDAQASYSTDDPIMPPAPEWPESGDVFKQHADWGSGAGVAVASVRRTCTCTDDLLLHLGGECSGDCETEESHLEDIIETVFDFTGAGAQHSQFNEFTLGQLGARLPNGSSAIQLHIPVAVWLYDLEDCFCEAGTSNNDPTASQCSFGEIPDKNYVDGEQNGFFMDGTSVSVRIDLCEVHNPSEVYPGPTIHVNSGLEMAFLTAHVDPTDTWFEIENADGPPMQTVITFLMADVADHYCYWYDWSSTDRVRISRIIVSEARLGWDDLSGNGQIWCRIGAGIGVGLAGADFILSDSESCSVSVPPAEHSEWTNAWFED